MAGAVFHSHITSNATEELLCGRPHKLSQTHAGPSGSFDTGKQSIGSMKVALALGNEINESAGIGRAR